MKTVWARVNKKVFTTIATINLLLLSSTSVYADGGAIGNTPLVTGTKLLIDNIEYVLGSLAAGICTVFLIKNLLAYKAAGQQEREQLKKVIIGLLIAFAFAITAPFIVDAIQTYYQG